MSIRLNNSSSAPAHRLPCAQSRHPIANGAVSPDTQRKPVQDCRHRTPEKMTQQQLFIMSLILLKRTSFFFIIFLESSWPGFNSHMTFVRRTGRIARDTPRTWGFVSVANQWPCRESQPYHHWKSGDLRQRATLQLGRVCAVSNFSCEDGSTFNNRAISLSSCFKALCRYFHTRAHRWQVNPSHFQQLPATSCGHRTSAFVILCRVPWITSAVLWTICISKRSTPSQLRLYVLKAGFLCGHLCEERLLSKTYFLAREVLVGHSSNCVMGVTNFATVWVLQICMLVRLLCTETTSNATYLASRSDHRAPSRIHHTHNPLGEWQGRVERYEDDVLRWAKVIGVIRKKRAKFRRH